MMKHPILTLSVLFSLTVAAAWGQSAGDQGASVNLSATSSPSLSPSFTVGSSPATGRELLCASLLFSECTKDSEEWNASLKSFDSMCAEVRSSSFLELSEEARSEEILSLLYKKALVRYESGQTRVHTALLNGTYNCVAASTLYACLAKEAGITVTANETKDHAFCTVVISGKKIDVETTNPGGFNPGTRKEIESSGGRTKYFIVPKKYYSGRKEISIAKLTTLSARNLCSNYNDRNNYHAAIPLAAARLLFADYLPQNEKSDVRSDFDTLCTNYAIDFDHKNQHEAALNWLIQVIEAYGSTPPLTKTFSDISYNGFATRMNKNDYEGTLAFLSKYESYINKSTLSTYRQQVIEGSWYQKVKDAFNKEEYLKAASIAEEGLKEIPGNRTLTNARNTALKNHAVVIHNEYARLVNAGKYEEALKVAEEGLSQNPTSTVLQNDVKKVKSYKR